MSDPPIPTPPGYAAVAPWLISRDTEAELAFLAAVFGATERPGSRVMTEGRVNHVEVDLAGSALLLFDASEEWEPTPGHLRVYVGDLDASLRAAEELGARVVTRPTFLPFGDSVARVRDPQGHLWWLHQHLEDVPVDDMVRRFAEPRYVEASVYVGASLDAELRARASAARSGDIAASARPGS